MRTLYYSDDPDSPHFARCKEAYRIFSKGYRDGMDVRVKTIEMEPDRHAKTSVLPILTNGDDDSEVAGDDAIRALAELLHVDALPITNETAPNTPTPSTPGSGTGSMMPPLPATATAASAVPTTVAPAAMLIKPVDPTYVLYLDDTVTDILVPSNGAVQIQSYKAVMATLGHKLPNYLKVAQPSLPDDIRRPMPVLVTCDGMRPTPMYGIMARDWLRVLCELNGAATRVA